MKGKDLLLGMNFVDDTFVCEAEKKQLKKVSIPAWQRWGGIAAGFAVILTAALLVLFQNGGMSSAIVTGEKRNQSAIAIDMQSIFVNSISGFSDAAKKQYDPELYDNVLWEEEDITAYYQKDLTPAYIPEGLTASPYNGKATAYVSKSGEIAEDAVYLSFYHDYYKDGSPKLSDDVAALKGFSLTASKIGIVNDCIYILPENEIKTSDIGGITVQMGYRSMPYGPYDPQTHMPSGYYDLYVAEFRCNGINYEIIFEQMELEEAVKVVSSIIYGGSDFIISK